MANETLLADIKADLASRLAADAYFSDIVVVTDRQGDIASKITRALSAISGKGGKCGVAAIVMQPVGKVVSGNVPIPTMELELAIRVVENVVINLGATGTQKDASSIARRIVDVLHLYTAAGLCDLLQPKSPTIIPVEDPLASVAYEVQFTARENQRGTRFDAFKCAQVSMAAAGSALPYTITLACGTSGASIYYTTDGTYPSASNTTATLYATPFTITTACTLRAGAVKTNLIASDVAYAVIS